MATRTPITVAHGDGIHAEIMPATPNILKEAGAPIRFLGDTSASSPTVNLRNYAGEAGFTLAQGQ
jgi:isocitrate/isopropylmalate dehydrogenase